jgi:hypothetical protein
MAPPVMNKIAAAVLASSLLVPAVAHAQDPEAEAPAAQAQPTPVTITIPACRLAEHDGFEEADARTAGQLVCLAIGRAGASPTERYRVSLGKLGNLTILSVVREGATIGSTVDSREMRLQGIEEVEIAAPRIAESIVHGSPIADTQKVDNLVGGETRVPKSAPGKVHFALGLVGLMPPLDQGAAPAPGVDLDLHYETASGRLELGGSFRAGGGAASNTAPSMAFAIFSLGGRYYLNDTDFSPYVGGGLSWGYLNLKIDQQSESGDNSGLGAYVDAGFEIMRTHHTHLALGARLDLPFYALNMNQSYNYSGCAYNACTPTSTAPASPTYYYAPLSLEARITF